MHIAIVWNKKEIALFINKLLVGKIPSKGTLYRNPEPLQDKLFIGGLPSENAKASSPYILAHSVIDNFRISSLNSIPLNSQQNIPENIFSPSRLNTKSKNRSHEIQQHKEDFENKLAEEFENLEKWNIFFENGADGKVEITNSILKAGKNAFKISKYNAKGYIRLVSKKPLLLKKQSKYCFSGYFSSQNNSISSCLLFRISLSGERGVNLQYDDIDKAAGYMSQSLLINTPPGKWYKRVIHFFAGNSPIYLNIVVIGNPCTFVLDDLSIRLALISPPPSHPQSDEKLFASSAVNDILERRTSSNTILIRKNGYTLLSVNKNVYPPVFYKESPYPQKNKPVFYEDFSKAGVPFLIRTLMICELNGYPGIWQGDNKYDWSILERDMNLILKRNPYAKVILEIPVTHPYRGWGKKHSNEIWRNKCGEKAYGLWGNIEGFTDNIDNLNIPESLKRKYWYYPSYHSLKWKADTAKALKDIISYLLSSPYGKAIVGFHIVGGHDAQFVWHHVNDYSGCAKEAFAEWLKNKYGSIDDLNRKWRTSFSDFNSITLDNLSTVSENQGEYATPFLNPGIETDYRQFRIDTVWNIKDFFAEVIKSIVNNKVIVTAYGNLPDYQNFGLRSLKSLDGVACAGWYPFRLPGYPLGVQPESLFHLYGKLWINELDIRSWACENWDEVYKMWIGAGLTPQDWNSIYMKMAGVAIASGQGYWHYNMNRYFDDSLIMKKIAEYYSIYSKLIKQTFSHSNTVTCFRPDVCIVKTPYANTFIRSTFSGAKFDISMPFQEMMLEASGVPFDIHYLDDILKYKELQTYKMYVFIHTLNISTQQIQAIKRLLQNNNRVIIWVYNPGYISENGKSLENMKILTGFDIKTEEKYERRVSFMLPAAVPPEVKRFQGMSELLLSIMSLKGKNKFIARTQPFQIKKSDDIIPIAKFENGEISMAIKKCPNWTSIYLAPPFSLGSSLFNYFARHYHIYVAAPPGYCVKIGSSFISVHVLKNGKCTLILPKNKQKLFPLSTPVHLQYSPQENSWSFPAKAGQTFWFSY